MSRKELDVLIEGTHAGILSQSANGSLAFRYLRQYRGVPLSIAMPLSTKEYGNKVVLPYLWGLLPEDPAARRAIAAKGGVSHNNPFALLGIVGLDCPGAVQFCPGGSTAARDERLVALSDADIADRLSRATGASSGWVAENERWSLGGQQSKIALRRQGGQWFSCEGSAATTHILKSGVAGLAHQALNEFVCMRLASKCNISAANAEYCEFSGAGGAKAAIVIERYDRVAEGKGIRRLHQEDLCQALGCLPDNKYAQDGGPSSADALGLLLSCGPASQSNAASFLQMLFFNCLIAATDAHAKNYSIMLSRDGAHRLAPMYDVASIAPYAQSDGWRLKPPKLAMSIGGENRVGRLTRSDLERLVARCDLQSVNITAEGCAELVSLYAEIIPPKLAEVFDDLRQTESAKAASELRSKMEGPIQMLCADVARQVQR